MISIARVIAAMILCAGRGSRLAPLTTYCAKPAVPVGDRPMLSHVEARVARVTSRIVVNVHHREADVRAIVRPGVQVSEEAALLGTAGGVRRARALLGDGAVLVWNGDIFADVDADALVAAHQEASARVAAHLATLAIRTAAVGVGNVGVDRDGLVVRLRRETFREGEVQGGEFLGIHMLSEAFRASPVSPDGWQYVGGERDWAQIQHSYSYSGGKLVHTDPFDHYAAKAGTRLSAEEKTVSLVLYRNAP